MQRDADGDLFFGFCGARVYVPEPPRQGELSGRVLSLFRQRLAEELAKGKDARDQPPANARLSGPQRPAQGVEHGTK